LKVIHQGLKPDSILKLNAEVGDTLPEQILIKHNERLAVYEMVWKVPITNLNFGDDSND